MAKRTAVIDIGSNSMRMAVFEKSSRFAFHIIHEVKSSVRLSEHAYSNDGNLQPIAMDRTASALGEFLSIAHSFNARKIFCVATSALRDAPNKQDFLHRIKQQYKLSIKVIDGSKEAFLGGLACANLLPKSEAISVDIGGGSTEFSLVKDGKVELRFSLNIGTVRIKELYLDKNDIMGAKKYIDATLQQLPSFSTNHLVGIGGTFRALSRGLMKKSDYPLKKLHGFSTDAPFFLKYMEQILEASDKKLRSLHIKPDRFDTIKPGTLILERIVHHLKIKQMTCSGAGVREGVFLEDLLRNSNFAFPKNYNPNVRYLLDTYITHSHHGIECAKLLSRVFDQTHAFLELDASQKSSLIIAAKLLPLGIGIRYYGYQTHSHYFAMNALQYQLTHEKIALISHLLLFKKNHLSSEIKPKGGYSLLLPNDKVLDALYSLLWLSHILLAARGKAETVKTTFTNGCLYIEHPMPYLAQEQLKTLPLSNLKISFKN